MNNDKPLAVIPENLSEMSPQSAWNLAIEIVEALAGYHAFWNDGQYLYEDTEKLKVQEETDEQRRSKPKIRYRSGPRRLVDG